MLIEWGKHGRSRVPSVATRPDTGGPEAVGERSVVSVAQAVLAVFALFDRMGRPEEMNVDPDPIRAAEEALDALGPDAGSDDIATARAALGSALTEGGRAAEGVDLLQRAVAMLMTSPTASAGDVSNAMGLLGRALTEDRRYSEARDVLSKVVQERVELFGPNDARTLVARGNLLRAVASGG